MTFPRKTLVSLGAAAVLSLLVFAAPAMAGGAEEALAWVPADAVSVGVVRIDALRSSPLAARLFEQTDEMAVDGDAAKFLEETGLRPKQDVDLMVVAGLGGSGGRGISHALLVFEGRFDPARLSAAMEARGATRKRTPYGEYLSLEDKGGHDHPGAVAFVSPRLLVAGSASAVTRALEDRAAGKSGFLRGEGLGRHLSRVPGDASAWAIVDAVRAPIPGRRSRSHEGDGGDPADALIGAMKSVSLFVFHATARGDSIEISATGLSADDETRELLADALKGVVAMWRLAVHEKSPELVPILRRFEIENDGEGVTVTGTLPSSFVRKMTDRRQARK
ncbi:MAG: hypothetical protein ABI610_06665 [Acidobacteriota bacterium]